MCDPQNDSDEVSWEQHTETGKTEIEAQRYSKAERAYALALEKAEKFGNGDPRLPISLENLAALRKRQQRYSEAEEFYRRALAMRESTAGREHPDMVPSLRSLAGMYLVQSDFGKAAQVLQQTLRIRENTEDPRDLEVAESLIDLAEILPLARSNEDPLPLYKRAIALRERALGREHRDAIDALNRLADYLRRIKKDAEAQELYKKATALKESALGPHHPLFAKSLIDQATQDARQGKYIEPVYQRILAIANGANPLERAEIFFYLGKHYGVLGREPAKALQFYNQSLSIRERELGPDHLDLVEILKAIANAQYLPPKNDFAAAAPFHERVVKIHEKVLGPYHPQLATSLSALGDLYGAQRKFAEAEKLEIRALAIREKVLDQYDIEVAFSLLNLGHWNKWQSKRGDAEAFYKRVETIGAKIIERGKTSQVLALTLVRAYTGLINIYTEEGRQADVDHYKQKKATLGAGLGRPEEFRKLGLLYGISD
jgi:tetratricopeptide (TPR) repeat protein